MNELTFWSNHVKPALNSTHFDRVAWKVGTSTRAGIPDVAYRSRDRMAWLELKWVPDWPVRDTTPLTLGLTLEQIAHLRDWCRSEYGHGFVIALIGKEVLVFPHSVPNVIQRTNLDLVTLIRIPLKDTTNLLARELDAHLFPLLNELVKEGAWAPLP